MPTLVPSWYFVAPSFLKIQKLGAKKYWKIDFLLRMWTYLKANENRPNQGQVSSIELSQPVQETIPA